MILNYVILKLKVIKSEHFDQRKLTIIQPFIDHTSNKKKCFSRGTTLIKSGLIQFIKMLMNVEAI